MKGKMGASSAIHIGTLLEEVINNCITHLTLDFSRVLRFEYTGIALLMAVLEFYTKDFSEITCCGPPQNISYVFKGLGVEKIPNIRVAHHRDLMISNL